MHSLSPCPVGEWDGSAPKKMLDTTRGSPYATPSMQRPSSPRMLTRATPVPIWTERGDPGDAHEEEGRQEKEEVAVGRLSEAGGHLRSPIFS